MLNFTSNRAAKLRYLSGSYHILADGDHVTCAVTGVPIPVSELRYWSHELQEAYVSAEAAAKRYAEARAQGLV